MTCFWEFVLKGADENVIVQVRPNLVDARGNPIREPVCPVCGKTREQMDRLVAQGFDDCPVCGKPPDTSWHKDINPNLLYQLQGHTFEIVGITSQGIVSKWRGPGKSKRAETARRKK